jgi:ribulose-bisphosphate carboxylase large chain
VTRVGGAEGLGLSGERFSVTYALAADEPTAREMAADICIEQTVEFPQDLIASRSIREGIFGRIETFRAAGSGEGFEAVVSYAVEITGYELTQLLNVLFGNISIKPHIRVQRIDLGATLAGKFRGPRFGRQGLRALTAVQDRVLLCAALKPMGLSAAELADLAGKFALGGIDLIKDDHGLADQAFSPFEERVKRCAEAVARANERTGGRCLYLPNVTADGDGFLHRAVIARAEGAGGVVISPGLTGFDAMRRLADDDEIGLPVLYHPAFQGSFVTSPRSGLAHGMLFGQLARLCGADGAIFPSYGGRFSFTREQCREIVESTGEPMEHLKRIFPCPGGGMTMESMDDMLDFYGREAVFLMGGGLFRLGKDLVKNCRSLLERVSGA